MAMMASMGVYAPSPMWLGLWKLPRGWFEGQCGEIAMAVLLSHSVKLSECHVTFWDFAVDLTPEALTLDSRGFCILELLTTIALPHPKSWLCYWCMKTLQLNGNTTHTYIQLKFYSASLTEKSPAMHYNQNN